jgi:membrane protein
MDWLPSWPSPPSLRASAAYYGRSLVREIADKQLFLWAQAIAFKVLVTVVPIVVLTTGLVGRLLQRNDAFTTVARFIRSFLPEAQSEQLIYFLEQLQNASGTVTLIGSIGLFLSAVSLFITLRVAVSNAFEHEWHEGRSILRSYLFDVRMVLQVGLLFVLTIGLSVVGQSLDSVALLRDLGLGYAWIESGWRQVLQMVTRFVPLFVTTAMFYQLYYFVPKPHPRKRSAFTGAVVASVLWEAAKQAFAFYATYVGRFDRYGSAGGEGTFGPLDRLGNTFGLIIAFVIWVYFSGVVLILGAVIAALRENRMRASETEEATANEVAANEVAANETGAAEGDGAAPRPPGAARPGAPAAVPDAGRWARPADARSADARSADVPDSPADEDDADAPAAR